MPSIPAIGMPHSIHTARNWAIGIGAVGLLAVGVLAIVRDDDDGSRTVDDQTQATLRNASRHTPEQRSYGNGEDEITRFRYVDDSTIWVRSDPFLHGVDGEASAIEGLQELRPGFTSIGDRDGTISAAELRHVVRQFDGDHDGTLTRTDRDALAEFSSPDYV